jgi:hypothetical protein
MAKAAMAYWRKVFARAWADTRHSFGWNQKTVAIVLVAIAGVAVVFFQLGFSAALANAAGLLWTALPIVGAGVMLFVWNFFAAPPSMHTELGEKIAALEAALANLRQQPPDYAAWRHVDRLTLRQAAFLWCDLAPSPTMPSNVRDWYEALASAVRKGALDFEPKYSRLGQFESERVYQKRNPQLDTIVTRKALQGFAKRYSHDPKFLRDG